MYGEEGQKNPKSSTVLLTDVETQLGEKDKGKQHMEKKKKMNQEDEKERSDVVTQISERLKEQRKEE